MDDTSRAEQKTQPFSTARDLYSSNNYKAAAEQSRVRHFQNNYGYENCAFLQLPQPTPS